MNHPTLLLCPKPKILLGENFCVTSPIFKRYSSSPMPRIAVVKCSNSSEQSGASNLRDTLSGMVDERVEQLLNREENRALLDNLEKASQRVESAKKELAEIEKQENETKQMRDYINQLESRAFEIAESQKELIQARAMVEEAERSLSLEVDAKNALVAKESEEELEIDRDEERVESVKAALVSAIVGTLAGLPISFTQVTTTSQLVLPVAITFISCALFGVTFRYTIRRDLDNIHLKTGTSAAFSFVKGLGTLGGGPPLELDTGSFLSHAVDGAVYVSENLLIFVFAAVSLDFCFKMGILNPFPIKRSVPRTNLKGE